MRNINEISQRDCIYSNVYAVAFVYEFTVFAMQTQSRWNNRKFRAVRCRFAAKCIRNFGKSGSDETTSASSEKLASQDSSISQNSEISLPEVSVGSEVAGIISKGTDVTPSNNTQTWLGIVFWICIAIGILIIVVVIVAAIRKTPTGGTRQK